MPVLKRKKGEKKSAQYVRSARHEMKRGKLHSGSKTGPLVKNPKQAIAIGLSQARKAGAKVPKKKPGKQTRNMSRMPVNAPSMTHITQRRRDLEKTYKAAL